jgi:signal transduction histidine kinase
MALASRVPVRRMLLATLALNTLIALAITAFSRHGHGFINNLVLSQCIGLLTYAAIDLPRRRLWPAGPSPMLPMAALVLAGACIGWFGGSLLGRLLLGLPPTLGDIGTDAAIGFFTLTVAAGFAATGYFQARERIAASEALAAEARLRLLSAQIEPHFLFNTLANLQALITVDPLRAQAMLTHLDRYLRATLSATRDTDATLGAEFGLLRAYLEIIAIRMGQRLAFELDLPAAVAGLRVLPMLLQPLVENAIQHGLEPKIAGGRVRVQARMEAGRLCLVVEDDGCGIGTAQTSAGTGVGLANVRERLAAHYGNRAQLDIAARPAGGTVVTLTLPLQGGHA